MSVFALNKSSDMDFIEYARGIPTSSTTAYPGKELLVCILCNV